MIFPAVTAILGLAGAGLSLFGSNSAAKAAEKAARRQQQVADIEARNIELTTAENIGRARTNARRRLARIRSEYGTSGVVADGSTADVFAETAGRLELEIQDAARAGVMDAANRRSAGETAAWEGRVRAASMRMQSYGTLLSDVTRTTGNIYNLVS